MQRIPPLGRVALPPLAPARPASADTDDTSRPVSTRPGVPGLAPLPTSNSGGRGYLTVRGRPLPPTHARQPRGVALSAQPRAALETPGDEALLNQLSPLTGPEATHLQRFRLWQQQHEKNGSLESLLKYRGDFGEHPNVKEFFDGIRGKEAKRRALALVGVLSKMRVNLLSTQLQKELQGVDSQAQACIEKTKVFIQEVCIEVRCKINPTMGLPWKTRLVALQEYALHLHRQQPPSSLAQAVPMSPFDPAADPQVKAFLDTLATDDLVRTELVPALNLFHRRHFDDPWDSRLRPADLAAINKFLEGKQEHNELRYLLTAARLRRIAAYLATAPGQQVSLAGLARDAQALQHFPGLAKGTSLSQSMIRQSLQSLHSGLSGAVLLRGAVRDLPLLDKLSAQLGPDADGLRRCFSEWLLADAASGGLEDVLAWRGDFNTDPRVRRFIEGWTRGEAPDTGQVADMLAEARAHVHHEDIMKKLHESDLDDVWSALQKCSVRIAQVYCDGLDVRAAPLPTVWTNRLSALAEFALFHGRTALTEAIMPGAFDPLNDDQVLDFMNSLEPGDYLRQEFLPGLKVLLHRDPLDPGDAGLRLEDREAIALHAASLPDDPHGHGARLSAVLRTIATALNTAEEQPQPFLMEAATDAGVRASLEPLLSLLEFQEEEVTGALKALAATAVAVAGPLHRFGSVGPVPGASPSSLLPGMSARQLPKQRARDRKVPAKKRKVPAKDPDASVKKRRLLPAPLRSPPKERPPLAPSKVERREVVRPHFAGWLSDRDKRIEDLLLHRGDYSQRPECREYLDSETGAGVKDEVLNRILSLERPAACAAQAYERLARDHSAEADLIRKCRQSVRRLYPKVSRGSANPLPPLWESRLLALTDLALHMGQEDPPRSLSHWLKSDSGQLDRDIPGVVREFPQDSVTGPDRLREALNLARGRDINDPGDLGSRDEDIAAIAKYEQITSARPLVSDTFRRYAAALRTYAKASAAAKGPLIDEAARDKASQDAAARLFGGGLVLAEALKSLAACNSLRQTGCQDPSAQS